MASISLEDAGTASRGRGATTPQHIPPVGWKDVALRTFTEFGRDRVTLIAAGVTYFLLLSIFPMVTAFVSIYGLFADPGTVARQLDLLTGIVPPGGLDIIREQLTRITEQGTPTLGLTLLVSLAIALWSASAGVRALFDAMNAVYGEVEKRNFFVVVALSLVFTLGGIVIAMLMLGVVLAIPVVLGFVGLGNGMEWLVQIAGYVLLLVVLFTGLSLLYRFGPSRQQARWRWITPGSTFAVVVIGIVSALYSWYAANFAHYDQTYGSLGALIGFLFWMWVTLTVIILGAELDSEIEHQTRRDSTTGAPLPMGDRDAAVADTLGRAVARQQDDPRNGKSADWVRGYEEGRRQSPHRAAGLPIRYAVPAALLLGWLGGRRRS